MHTGAVLGALLGAEAGAAALAPELSAGLVNRVEIGAEIDAVESFGGKDRYVELKTSKLIRTPRDRVSFERARPCSISARIRPHSSPTVSIPRFELN